MRPAMKKKTRAAWQPLYGYSTNVHRGETLAEIYTNLARYTLPVKRRVFGNQPNGLELHISISSAKELRKERARRAFGEFLNENGLRLFSVNAFPLKSFHTPRVKEKVYSPSWTERPRAQWTNTIAKILADLLPAGTDGSLSTLGGAYRRKEHGPAVFRRMAGRFLETLEALAEIEDDTGKRIVLAVEPEPETTFETTRDVVRFVEDYLLPLAQETWRGRGRRGGRQRGLSAARIEERVRRYFTVNFDTCHFSVLFQDLVASLRGLSRAGLSIGKLHVTNAIRLQRPLRSPAAYKDFRGMHEPRYFHQFCGQNATGETIWRDLDLDRLPRQLSKTKHAEVAELRSHYHVPLYLKRFRKLQTTQEDTRIALEEVRRKRMTEHLVIETYTWPILASEDRLVSGIVKEFRWLLDALGQKPVSTAKA
jgi:hypothetical protein